MNESNNNQRTSQPLPTGVLLANLGTPDEPTPHAVRRYLAEFLSDPRVIDTPRLLWWFILHGIILRTRPRRSAAAYREIWTEKGSPLLEISKRQATALQAAMEQQAPAGYHIALGMRYGNPSIASALAELKNIGINRLLILPLYPQFSATTTASAFDAVADECRTWSYLPNLRIVSDYHVHPAYIHALVESIRSHWNNNGRMERLLFSFHGVPEDYITAGDPYYEQCRETARQVAQRLEIPANGWLVSFQSRLGPRKWLKPYTDVTLRNWAESGIKSVEIICPGFSVDCLETLEEIDIRYRHTFVEAGGKAFHYIAALNDTPAHLRALGEIIAQQTDGWQ